MEFIAAAHIEVIVRSYLSIGLLLPMREELVPFRHGYPVRGRYGVVVVDKYQHMDRWLHSGFLACRVQSRARTPAGPSGDKRNSQDSRLEIPNWVAIYSPTLFSYKLYLASLGSTSS